MEHHIKLCMKHIHAYSKSYMVLQFTLWHLALGGIARFKQGHFGVHYAVYHTQCIIRQFVCWGLTSLCHSNGHIETMPAREITPVTALTRIRSQFLRTQWSTSNHSEWTRLRIRPLSHRGWLLLDSGLPGREASCYGLMRLPGSHLRNIAKASNCMIGGSVMHRQNYFIDQKFYLQ